VVSAGNVEQAAAGADARFEDAYGALLNDGSVQFELTAAEKRPEAPEWLRVLGDWIKDALRPVGDFFAWITSFMPEAPYARILLWTMLIVAAIALAWLLVQRLRTGRWQFAFPRRRQAELEEVEEAWTPEQATARAWLEEADALAARGDYAEAVHHLLRRSIEDIDYRRPRLVRPALTSRDLAGAEAIPSQARALFASIVGTVERSLFGGRAVSAGEWDETRAAYAEFVLRKAWKA
jgi:hypothetical protein